MKTFEKGNNFAVVSGILFILTILLGLFSIIATRAAVNEHVLVMYYSNIVSVLLNIILILIPSAVLGLQLIKRTINLGLIIPVILRVVGIIGINIANWWFSNHLLYSYDDGYGACMAYNSITLGSLFYLLFQILPWIMLFIVLLQCKNTNAQTKNSSLSTLCFIPAGSYFIVSMIIQLFITGGSILLIIINIAGILVTTAALALLGVWIHVNTRNEQTVSTAVKQYGAQNSPQQGGNQQYYQQPYPAQYSPQYNSQTGVPQSVPGQQYYQQQYPQQTYPQQTYPQQQYYQSPGYQQPATPQQRSDASSEAEAIKTYKELLDNGMITQEEYELKKKQILGI